MIYTVYIFELIVVLRCQQSMKQTVWNIETDYVELTLSTQVQSVTVAYLLSHSLFVNLTNAWYQSLSSLQRHVLVKSSLSCAPFLS